MLCSGQVTLEPMVRACGVIGKDLPEYMLSRRHDIICICICSCLYTYANSCSLMLLLLLLLSLLLHVSLVSQASSQLQTSIVEFTHQALDYSYQVGPSLPPSLPPSFYHFFPLSLSAPSFLPLNLLYTLFLQLNLVQCLKGHQLLDKVKLISRVFCVFS